MKRDNIIKNVHENSTILLRMYMKHVNIIKNVHETRQYY